MIVAHPWPWRLRAWSLPVLAVFIWHVTHHWRRGQLGNACWTCIVTDAVLAIGLAAGIALLVRTSALIHLYGLPLWLVEMSGTGGWSLPSAATHAGCLVVALYALRTARFVVWTWIAASALLMVTQLAARLLTDPELNVNLAHHLRPGWERLFPAYWEAWLAGTIISALIFITWERILLLVFPPRVQESA